jgi:hypothetical protein
MLRAFAFSPVPTANAIVATRSYSCDLSVGELSAPKVRRFSKRYLNTIATRSIGLALNGPFCVDPAGRRGFRDPQAFGRDKTSPVLRCFLFGGLGFRNAAWKQARHAIRPNRTGTKPNAIWETQYGAAGNPPRHDLPAERLRQDTQDPELAALYKLGNGDATPAPLGAEVFTVRPGCSQLQR